MTTRERRVVFGEVADDYDRVRPGYPAQLADDVLAADYPAFLRSFSIYRMLEPAAAAAVIAETVAVVEAHGDVLDLAMVTDLVLARRA